MYNIHPSGFMQRISIMFMINWQQINRLIDYLVFLILLYCSERMIYLNYYNSNKYLEWSLKDFFT